MQTCPFNTDCDLVAAEEFQQAAPRQFFREVYCRTHDKTYNETLRVAGYFVVQDDGHEGKFIPTEPPGVLEVGQ